MTTAARTSPQRPRSRRGTTALGPFVSPPEGAKYLGIGRTQIYELMNRHDLPWYELEGTRGRRIRVADLDRLLRRARPS